MFLSPFFPVFHPLHLRVSRLLPQTGSARAFEGPRCKLGVSKKACESLSVLHALSCVTEKMITKKKNYSTFKTILGLDRKIAHGA